MIPTHLRQKPCSERSLLCGEPFGWVETPLLPDYYGNLNRLSQPSKLNSISLKLYRGLIVVRFGSLNVVRIPTSLYPRSGITAYRRTDCHLRHLRSPYCSWGSW